ncbi:MAG: LysM peptidoglycan-binding domain-containing protein [Planctomycetes bacterium]|nr:LysM peptidoglycan-binding domain-containing protein [Planctomycetota bacterium]
MKKVLFSLVFTGLLAACSLTGLNTTNVQKSADTEPTPVAEANTTPVIEQETEAAVETPATTEETPTDTVVVGTGDAVPETIEPAVDVDLVNGLTLHEEGRLRESRVLLTQALDNNLDDEDEAKALKALRDINSKIFLSTNENGDLKVYTVKSGDTLGKIARAHGTTWEMIQRLNGMTTTRIDVGQKLNILGGKFDLVVRKQKFVMDLLLDGAFIQRYEVGLGVDGCTPLGEFTVKNRIPKPADGAYPYGHAEHRLGSRWLGMHSDEGLKGYGIHGCRAEEEDLIPGECSKGCVRMKNTDIQEIYDIVPEGTRVVVQER